MNFKAFTLIELITVMAISSIVLYLGFLLFSNFQSTTSKFVKNRDTKREVHGLYTQIQKEFLEANFIEVSDQFIGFSKKDHYSELEIGDSVLVLNRDGITDSVFVKINNVLVDKVNESLLSFLQIDFQFGKHPMEWSFHKEYAQLKLATE